MRVVELPARDEESTTIRATGTKGPSEATVSTSRIPELDGLRGIAIALVLVHHFFDFVPGAPLGWSGVDLFFVLSGFLIGGILLDARGSPNYFKTFYARRAFRILPAYYALIGAYIFVMIIAGRYLEAHVPGGEGGWEKWSALIAQVLFLQNFHTLAYSSVIGGTWFVATWSLAVEEQFYIVAPMVIRFLNRRRLYLFLGIVILSAPILRTYIHWHLPIGRTDDLSLAYTLMPCRADALAIGVLTALLWRSSAFRVWLSDRVSVLLIAVTVFFAGVGALCKWAPYHDSIVEQSAGYTWIAIFYALVVLLALAKPSGWLACFARMAWLRELGKVSYCMYLIQMAVGMFCQAFLIGILRRVTSWQFIALNCGAVFLTYAIARLSWAYFENPLLQRGHKYKY
jgi:peptidoglycan/LPS O-acetylase OafA/YrhL